MTARTPWTGVGPRPTGNFSEVHLTGMLIAWDEEAPVLLRIPGSADWYLACFSTEDALRALYDRVGIAFTRIQRVDDGDGFLASVEESPDVIVIVDPYYTPEGRIRYTQVPRMAGAS